MQVTRRAHDDDERPMAIEPLALERCGVFVVFHQAPVAGDLADARPHVVIYHAQPRDTHGRLVEREDTSDGLAELLHETLRAGHECVARGALTAYDLTNPAAVSGLYAQVALLLVTRWPNPFALYTPEQFAALTLHPRAEVLNVYMREADFPALWHVEHVTSEGEPLRVYDIGLDLWHEMKRRAKTAKTGKKRVSEHSAPFAALNVFEGLRDHLAPILPRPDDDDDVLPATAEMLFDDDASPSSSAASMSDSSEVSDTLVSSDLTAHEKTALARLYERLGPHHRQLQGDTSATDDTGDHPPM